MTNETPVLIVGGGGAGLICSMLLSTLGVEHLLVSALPSTSILPKAHVLNQRTMEILGELLAPDQLDSDRLPNSRVDLILRGPGGCAADPRGRGPPAPLRLTSSIARRSRAPSPPRRPSSAQLVGSTVQIGS